ncbi:hypothetical protein [Piscinibacter sp.]|uniref:hypothetical protein n=1 Tax=Piscinibacter sp. TaxID=1903157 RepID=UPI00258C0C6D|nr:hypothetical protein [Piscinibacter sp.]
MKTPAEVRREFAEAGISVSEWARVNGFGRELVQRVLSGASAHRGQMHRIAVTLGLKHGVIVDTADFKPARGAEASPRPVPPAPSLLTSVAEMPTLAADLPANTRAALLDLQRALTEPATPPTGWPFVDPPAVAATKARRRAGPGRPGSVKPHQVVQVARYLKLGHTNAEAAALAKVSKATVSHIALGRLSVCQHPAVTGAGVTFPVQRGDAVSPPPRKNRTEMPSGPQERSKRRRRTSGPSEPLGASGAAISPDPSTGPVPEATQ